ncbi:MAG: hypothetical protein CMO81_09635 [Waddliaceae bacterium]|nr:hypothetical protein [Waddliaceae bacterium]|tara:strand:+ start:62 stop:526 length:465 start_codon:yes stop_codon:yes gene_type:complete
MRFSHTNLLILSGLIWLGVGCMLFPKGLEFVFSSLEQSALYISVLTGFLGKNIAAGIWILLALVLGYYKGKFVLSKTVLRAARNLESLANPAKVGDLFSRNYLILIAVMMGIGMGMNFLGVPIDMRGFIDIAVGAALIYGSILYFRTARALSQA